VTRTSSWHASRVWVGKPEFQAAKTLTACLVDVNFVVAIEREMKQGVA
jgi:hypothetical protein